MSQPHSTLTRRGFLQRGVLYAAPLILPAGFWSNSLAGNGPNSRIQLGLIGMGRRLTGIAGSFSNSQDTQIVAVNDCVDARREYGAQRVKELYQQRKRPAVPRQVTDFRELLADKSIDAVAIGTPDHWHAIMSIRAAGAGKHVYCEKPLTRTIGEGRAVVNAARKANIIFQTGSQQRTEYGGKFRQAVEYVRNGRIGKLKKICIGVGAPPMPDDLPEEETPAGTDWSMWLGPAPQRGFNSELCPLGVHKHFPRWRDYREYAGGRLSDIGAHHFDIAQWAMRMDASGPVEIIPPTDPNATQGLRFRYKSGIEMVHSQAEGRSGCRFVGSEGEIYVDRRTLECTPEKILEQPLSKADERLEEIGNNHQQNWIDCIRSGRKPVADVEIGHRTNSVCMLANLGYQLARPLRWDPDREQFKGDVGANSLINQRERSPWSSV
jgi:predicted dehydrogenase